MPLAELKILWDLIKGLIDQQEKNQRELIENYVEPIFSAFKKVHNDYLSSFENYLQKIDKNEPLNLRLIIKEIEQDKLFSQSSIGEIYAYVENSKKKDSLSEFVERIAYYLQSPSILLNQTWSPQSNVKRSSLIVILDKIEKFVPEKMDNPQLLDEIAKLENNQSNYLIVKDILSKITHDDISEEKRELVVMGVNIGTISKVDS